MKGPDKVWRTNVRNIQTPRIRFDACMRRAINAKALSSTDRVYGMGAGIVPVRQFSRSLSQSEQLKRKGEAPTAGLRPSSQARAVGPGETLATQDPTQAPDAKPGSPEGVGSGVGRRRAIGQPKVRPGRGRGGAPIRGRR